ncbi:methyltransferase [Prosthecobacter sp.]|uniref:methyltransferase n=1 Tax=Prosthecobacter sp. TaxID=1965333 RepID=UPI001D391AB6|nr:methyltransferase [Prosthecobacter sp.]MCB1277181.1 methyltransferase domain-containing protein [Prosthecobacter sp.]
MNITDWDQAYQENFTPWDKGLPSPPLVDWFAKNKFSGRVLVPGCGIGHDVAHLVSLGIDAQGLDISPTAIARAKERHPALADRFVCGDLFEVRDQFDAVVEHTCLCALPPDWRTRYRDTVASLLKPGGLLIGVFFINPEMDPGESGPPFGISTDELTALFAERFEVVETQVPTAAYPGREGRECVRVLRLTS